VQTHEQDLFDVLLVGHMDTVFPKGTAAQRPYHEENGKAYGPGVADMKAGLVLILHIMKRLRIERPDLKLCAAFSGDEEIGSDSTAEWLKSLAERSRFALVLEPGREGNGFVRSRKGCADLRVKFYGKAAHAGNAPERGINTVVAMAEWIRKLYVFHQPETGTTVNPGLVWGGTAKNVIPDYAEAVFDIRFMEAEALEKICGKAEELAANPPVAGIRTEIRHIMQKAYFIKPNYEEAEKGLARIKELKDQVYNGGYEITSDFVETKSLVTVAYIILTEVLERKDKE